MNVYLTYDYELFVNDYTGDIDHCLIIPTNEIMKMLSNHNVYATFFIDMAYAYRLNELKNQHASLAEDFNKFCKQVKDIKEQGHEIALHIHPQWFYADYDGNAWKMDFDHYKLSDMPVDEANEKFTICCSMLREISGYDVKSFRAGGFSIQDYTGFYHSLDKNGLSIDSSVLFGEKQITTLHSYDYSAVKSPEPYCFSENITVEDNNGKHKEFPISTISLSFFRYSFYKLKWMMFKKTEFASWGNGGDSNAKRNKALKDNIRRRFKNGARIWASADGRLTELLPIFLSNYKANNYNNLVILGHPKLASKGSIENIEKLIVNNKENLTFSVL